MAEIIRDAKAPFSGKDEDKPSDIIIRSSDFVDFHAHKAILSFSSEVFATMFTLPQPQAGEDVIIKDGKQVVVLRHESSRALRKLLLFCYPRFTGFHDLDGVAAAYTAADKYLMSGFPQLIERMLLDSSFLKKEPYRVFAIACHCRLENVAIAAAMEILNLPEFLPPSEIQPDFHLMTSYNLLKLLHFRADCSAAARTLALASAPKQLIIPSGLRSLFIYSKDTIFVWWITHGHDSGCGCSQRRDPTVELVTPSLWFTLHIQNACTVLSERPTGSAALTAVSQLKNSTFGAIRNCTKCVSEASEELCILAVALGTHIDAKCKKVGSLCMLYFSR